jgi:hypothetical protein
MTMRGRGGGDDDTMDRPRRHSSPGCFFLFLFSCPGDTHLLVSFFFVSLGPLAIHPMPMSACS